MGKLALHWQILIAMIAAIIGGIIFNKVAYRNQDATVIPTDRWESSEIESDVLVLAVYNHSTKKREELTIQVNKTNGTLPLENGFAKVELPTLPKEGLALFNAAQMEQYDLLKVVKKSVLVTLKPDNSFIKNWVKPFGTIFINLLKLIAMPLIIASLIKGISDLKDLSSLSKMGGRSIGIFVTTTVLAVSLGLLVVNLIQPGKLIKPETKEQLLEKYGGEAASRTVTAQQEQDKGPLQALEDLVPSNFFEAASKNGNMLQVIFFVVFFGIGLILIPEEKSAPVKAFFDGTNEVILKLIDIIMLAAPYGVFALMLAIIADAPSSDILKALFGYSMTVLIGLAIMIFGVYPTMVKVFAKQSPTWFMKGIAPAQMLAFSTSSSAATLPVTMERVQEHLGVDEEVASFVLPIGATVNMDGTSLYQAVAAVFIAQAFGMELSFGAQLGIIVTATLASIGSAAVPGAGMVMLVIVLAQAGIPEAGLALIFAVDRPLDMCRTIANVTGDAAVSVVVAKSLGKLRVPHEKNWDDHYPKTKI